MGGLSPCKGWPQGASVCQECVCESCVLDTVHHSHHLVLFLGLFDLQANRNWAALIDDFIDLDFLPQDANR